MNQDMSSVVFGAHSVCEVLKNNRRRVERIFTTKQESKAFRQVKGVLPSRIPVSFVERTTLNKLAGTPDHQGVVAAVAPFPFRKKLFAPERTPLVVFLDSVQDPRNLGAILRSAYCTGCSGVVFAGRQTAPLSGTAHRASAGLAERLEILIEPSPLEAAKNLIKAGYTLYSGALGGTRISEVDIQLPAVLVVGNEGEGVSSQIQKLSTRIMLPQQSADVSYNASVAAGLMMFLVSTKHHLI